MGKQTTMRKRSSQRRGRSRPQSRKPGARKQRPLGLWLLLVGVVLAMGVWELTRIPPGLLLLGTIAVLVVIFLLIGIWLVLRYRLSPEERNWRQGQQMELMRMEETAHMMGVRPAELADLACLTHEEFEYFTGALLEAMGVLFEWERVGGSGDHGIDLLGKNQYNLPLVVQCKHFFRGSVTPDKTRDFGWALGLHGADEAWFVTTASFTKQARADVRKLTFKGAMKLVDGETLLAYLREYWHALPNKWQWRLTECMAERDRQQREQ